MTTNQDTNEIHQVTVVFMDRHMAYAEGVTRESAWEEAQKKLPVDYKDAHEELEVIHEYQGRVQVVTYWEALTVWC